MKNPTGTPCYTVLDLFSGIGGFSLGLERTGGFRTIAFCEIEPFPRKVLRKHWPDVPIFEDVRKLHAADLPELPDVITGGYPCQPFSLTGERRGQDDDRHLWPEVLRLVQECRPTWVFCENVIGHITLGLDQVLADLEGENYTSWPFVLPACGVNAPQLRKRVWIVAHANEGQKGSRRIARVQNSKDDAWPRLVLPGRSGVDNGIPDWMDRVGACGNAVVPQVVEAIGEAILAV